MRIKMQCPDCGKWFTLELSVKEQLSGRLSAAHDDADASSRARNEGRPSANGAAQDRGSGRSSGRPAWPLAVAPILVVAAVVLVWFFLIGPAIERSRTGIMSETSAAISEERSTALDDGATEGSGIGVEEGTAVVEDTPDVVEEVSSATEDTRDVPTEAADAAADVPIVESARRAVETPASPGGDAPATVGESGPLEFELVATERCWVHVVTDGSIVYDLTLQPGERRRWRAERQVELAAGSGQSVEVYLNGELLGTAGPDSRVVEGLVVTSEGLVERD